MNAARRYRELIHEAARFGVVGGLGVVVTGELAVCQTENSATALRELLRWAADHDLGDLADLSVEAPTLEDAYLQLVARPMAETGIVSGARQADVPLGGRPPAIVAGGAR